MTAFSRFAMCVCVMWVLVATNPDAASFRRYIAARRAEHVKPFTLAAPTFSRFLKRILAPQPPPRDHGAEFVGKDCALFTIVYTKHSTDQDTFQDTDRFRSKSKEPYANTLFANSATTYAYIGVLSVWLPVPQKVQWMPAMTIIEAIFMLRDTVRSVFDMLDGTSSGPSIRDADGLSASLPARPWEGLIACFAVAGALWYVMPTAGARHFTLTWENVRLQGRWWSLILFHFSHGGSVLRLSRSVAACNYLAPLLLKHRVLTLSGLYGVTLTAAAMSTALGILVLARRSMFGARGAPVRSALEINGGGGCVYALLVAACLDAQGARLSLWEVKPFELLMLNIAFDAIFLAGQKRIADYIAHTGAALGAWIYCSFSRSR